MNVSGEFAIRKRKRDLLEALFLENIGKPISSFWLHQTYGTAARSRISDLNNDAKCRIFIRNRHCAQGDHEESFYISEWRTVTTDAREPEKARQKPRLCDGGASGRAHMDALDGFAARSPRRKSEARSQGKLFEEQRT